MKQLIYTGGGFDRAAQVRRDPAWIAARLADPASRLVPVWRARNLIRRVADSVAAAYPRAGTVAWHDLTGAEPILLGLWDGVAYFAVDLSAAADPAALPGMDATAEFVDLREVGTLLGQQDGSLLAYARALVHWHRTQRFCGACGAPTIVGDAGHMRVCTDAACATEHFPRTDPAIIVLVAHGEHCLLGRQPQWAPGRFSVLAGFVEPGETLEETVRREVMEETGVPVRDACYVASQPWPFPRSLMLGFRATAEHFQPPMIDGMELETAAWFSRADIAAFPSQGRGLPPRDSISRHLIEDWLAEG